MVERIGKWNVELSIDDNKKLAESLDLANFEFTNKQKETFDKKPFLLKLFIKYYLSQFFKKPFLKTENKNRILYWLKSAREILSQKIFQNKTLYEAIYDDIKNKLEKSWKTFSSIKSIWVDSGDLQINLEDWEFLKYDLSAKTLEGLVIKNETKEAIHNLDENREIVKKIAFAGTVISLIYTPVIVAWADTIDQKWWKLSRLKFTSYWREIEFEVKNWEKVKMNELEYHLMNNYKIIDLLDKAWYKFNPEKWQFEAKTSDIEFNRAVKAIKYEDLKKWLEKYSYKEYLEDMKNSWMQEGDILSEKEFKKLKKEWLVRLAEINREFNVSKKWSFWEFFRSKWMSRLFEWVIGKSLHLIMFPVFFKELHKHSGNLDALLKSSVEYFGFTTWAKLGSKIPWPLWVKTVFSLVVWTLWVVVWKEWLEHFDKKITKAMPNSEDFWQRVFMIKNDSYWAKAIDWVGHVISLSFINDIADAINTDIWLYNTDITLFSNNINFWTKIEDYMNERVSWVNHWNKEVEEFKIRAINRLKTEIFDKDFKYSDILKWEDEIEFSDIYKDSLSDKISKILQLIYNPRQKWGSVWMKYENKANWFAEEISDFIKKELPKNLLLWELKDINHLLTKIKSFGHLYHLCLAQMSYLFLKVLSPILSQ